MEAATTSTPAYHSTAYYWHLLKDMEQTQKLDIISMLIDSLKPTNEENIQGSYYLSQEDIRAGRVESFASSEEMFQSLGI